MVNNEIDIFFLVVPTDSQLLLKKTITKFNKKPLPQCIDQIQSSYRNGTIVENRSKISGRKVGGKLKKKLRTIVKPLHFSLR